MTPNPHIPEGLDPEIVEILETCCRSTKAFCQVFQSDIFDCEFSKGHDQLFELLDDPAKQKVAIAMPRGWGKTSIVNQAFITREIVFHNRNYIIPISSTGASATEFSENTKAALLTNEMIVNTFGSITTKNEGPLKDPFSTLEWVTSNGIKVKPRGARQQVRGGLFRGHRPDLFVVDDLEDDEHVESEEQRKKLMKWFFSALKNSVRLDDPNWRIIVVGTILHEDSLLSNLLDPDKFPGWSTIRLEHCDANNKSNWPERFSDEDCAKLKEEYKTAGDLDTFYREYRNLPIAIESRGFKPEYFKSYTETEYTLNNDRNVETAILLDPARTLATGSANTAIAGVSFNTMTNTLYVREIVEGKFYPDELYDEAFAMAERLNAIIIAPEVTGLNEYIMQPLRSEMEKRGVHYILIEVKPRQGKTGAKRSGGLVPLYRQGHVLHNPTACGRLEEYLLMWPRPKRWDAIDAVAGIIYVMDDGERFFTPQEDQEVDIEAEYREIDYDAPLALPSMC